MTKLEQAITFAVNAHEEQKRKGKERPYILHPLEVLAIVSALTEDEDVLCAAVLHDTVEDTSVKLDDIEEAFGPRVRALVAAESENKRKGQNAKDTWKIRKQETIDHLATAERAVQIICLGDKLANLREIARDYANDGKKFWNRFNQKDKNEHAWYYRSIDEILKKEFSGTDQLTEYERLIVSVFGEK